MCLKAQFLFVSNIIFFQIVQVLCVGEFLFILSFQSVCPIPGPSQHLKKSFLVHIQFLQSVPCHLHFPEDQIVSLELPSCHLLVMVLSCLLLVYGRSYFCINFYFFYQVKVRFKVLQIMLFIEGLSLWARDSNLHRDYYFSAKG